MNEPVFVEGAQGLAIPFCQGEIHACSQICVAVGTALLRNGTTMLAPPLVADQKMFEQWGKVGIESYLWSLAKRRKETPQDRNDHFTAGRVIFDQEQRVRERGAEPFWIAHDKSGYLLLRSRIAPDDNGIGGGTLPSLLDCLEKAWKAASKGKGARAVVFTDSEEYTRLAFFRADGMWLYNSHGHQFSTLYYFGDRLAHLVVYVLRCCGLRDEDKLALVPQYLAVPPMRPAVDWDPTTDGMHQRRYELVSIKLRTQ